MSKKQPLNKPVTEGRVMNNKVSHNKTIDNNEVGLSTLGKEIYSIEGVTELKEREIKKESNDIKTITGQFEYNTNKFNYIMIERNGYLFINFRFNVEYELVDLNEKYKERFNLLEHVNELNKRNLGLKTFIEKSDEDKILVSSNIEYVLHSGIGDFKFVNNALEILCISQAFAKIGKDSE
ncbi:hypothetical protein [Lelliottia amnigena]|uniref:hypothetical protein n=1 Tax=Lelliottia amnigena TaxID=61646 RepID=UPI0021D81405|nr:hypothetical protein [Lelliottia amnigena]MCU7781977.1 hypothetical protein [Lelliottia amnigena]